MDLKKTLKGLYEGGSKTAIRFRYGLLAFDLVTILFIVVSSFLRWQGTEYADAVIGVLVMADFIARLIVADRKLAYLISPLGIIDLVVIASLMAPLTGEGVAFLRIARILRIGRSYALMQRLKADFSFIRRNEQTVLAAVNLGVFLFIMTAIVYETQHFSNAEINNYADALYFTVTALTTTGFGDIVLKGTGGRLIASAIMIFGVTLFLRLVQVMLRPQKVDFKCPACGLRRHDYDAVHCKACGQLLNIENDSDA